MAFAPGGALAASAPAPLSLFSAGPAPRLPGPPRSQEADAQTYQRCMALAAKDPAAAQALAESWHAKGGAHPAEHCLAVALIGLKRYKEAAGRLETLAQAMVRAPAALRAGVLDQAAQAWLLAGDPARAYAAATSALNLKPDDPDLLVDRAEAAGAAGWFGKAVADLDRVLKADPARADALIYRASAYRAEGRLDPALTDIDRALKLAPQSAAALLERGNIRRLRGDIDGARGDWTRAAARAPGSAAASDAKDNLARLHSEKKSGPAAAVRPAGSK
ncbi:MAG TPA: tetratricopeptide repeat protein [Stellaceae bacterium]|nr:tetratricopeptide repeat protein [Stellaceae bacterium]